MKRLPLLALVVPLLMANDGDGHAILKSLDTWADTAKTDLSLPGAPPPYRTVLSAMDARSYEVRAQFGAIVSENSLRMRPGVVEVVVGDAQVDSSRYAGMGPPARQTVSLVLDDLPIALARELWTSSDTSYKAAIKQWRARETDQRARRDADEPADWTAAQPIVSESWETLPDIDAAKLRGIAVDSSQALWDLGGLLTGEVLVQVLDGNSMLATSEGTRLAQPEGHVVIYASAAAMRADGVVIEDQLEWVARRPADLPPTATIVADVKKMGMAIKRRLAAKEVSYYEGPVVFEGEAAAAVFMFLVPTELEGTPPPPSRGSYQLRTRSGPRLGRRLLPPGWRVMDDPLHVPAGLAGGYKYDREGVPAQTIELVDDGYVREFAMSRIPRMERTRSNGHARGALWRDWRGRLSYWKVEPRKNLSSRRFNRKVIKAMKAAEVDRVLVVKRLGSGGPGRLPAPTEAVWRSADGKEEPVLALELHQVERRALRDIVAAGGGKQTVPYMADWNPSFQWYTEHGLPMVVEAPRLLLMEGVESVFPGPSQPPHALPPPR